MSREPAVAGHFYPDDPDTLRTTVRGFLASGPEKAAAAVAILVPHAGYAYSGPVAGVTFASVSMPRVLVILCPNHTGTGEPIAVANRGVWRTPLGPATINETLADLLLEKCEPARADERAHRHEHAVEVQLPFLQVALPEFTFVPICVGTGNLAQLTRLGNDLAAVIADFDEPAAIIISSDMSHYLPAPLAREKDMMAIDRILAMDPVELFQTVQRHDISMCGISPAVAGMTAAGALGARSVRLIAYGHSGESNGDFDRVVGYAGLHFS